MSFFPKRRQASEHAPNMLPAAGPRPYQSQFPSFMSVYNIEEDSMENEKVAAPTEASRLVRFPPRESINQSQRQEYDSQNSQNPHSHLQHKHRDSTSTQASESTDSSPTTTISTADSSSLTDPSPSSSPESPVTIVPLSSFSATTFGLHSLDDLTMSDNPPDKPLSSNDRPLTSPAPRKPRNAKGLALKLPSVAADSPQRTSAPSSPSFIKPAPPKPRKKPSILSLQTSANPSFNSRVATVVPPTPSESQNPTLRHYMSSPNMGLFSPDPFSAPQGGMKLPPLERSQANGLSSTFRKPSALSDSYVMGTESTIDEEESPIKAQVANRRDADIGGDPFDHRQSLEDTIGKGYPNGPIMMYEPNVFLYLEPTAEEASQFDVIVNVAKEVNNPFATPVPVGDRSGKFDPMDVDRDNIPVPDTAATIASFRTAFEFQSADSQQTPTETSPTTPKPGNKEEPEYIHVPWEHNTDILPDLLNLCETIDSRAREGKRVLVHCQQGASRSASLIIAYTMYKNPNLTATEAYAEAKAKSEAVNPNMGLVFSLNKFGQELNEMRKQVQGGVRRTSGRSPHRTTASADAIDLLPKEPMSAPLPPERQTEPQDDAPSISPSRPRGNSTPNFPDTSPGPSSAPLSYTWTSKADTLPSQLPPVSSAASVTSRQTSKPSDDIQMSDPTLSTTHDQQSTATGFASHRRQHQQQTSQEGPQFGSNGSFVPPSQAGDLRQQFVAQNMVPPTPGLWSPRSQEMTGITPSRGFMWSSSRTDDDVPPTPSVIMSPRATEFSTSPFSPVRFDPTSTRVASNFRFVSAVQPSSISPPRTSAEDPRSPAAKGEASIIRSIDEMI